MITARTPSSSPALRSASPSWSSSSGVIALSTCGRLSVRVRTPLSSSWSSGSGSGWAASAHIARETLIDCAFAKLAKARERVDTGVVPVSPDRVQAVRADQRDVGELVLTGAQLGLGGEPTRKPGLAAAAGTRAGAP